MSRRALHRVDPHSPVDASATFESKSPRQLAGCVFINRIIRLNEPSGDDGTEMLPLKSPSDNRVINRKQRLLVDSQHVDLIWSNRRRTCRNAILRQLVTSARRGRRTKDTFEPDTVEVNCFASISTRRRFRSNLRDRSPIVVQAHVGPREPTAQPKQDACQKRQPNANRTERKKNGLRDQGV